jgi:hypothetical protein
MIRIKPPVVAIPTQEARAAIGANMTALAYCAYREIAMAAKGLEIAHLQFVFGKATFAVCSRLRRDGRVPNLSMHIPRSGRQPCSGIGALE